MGEEIALILSGCGVYDGSEVHESAAACAAITRQGKTPVFYAPDKKQHDSINHVSSADDTDNPRNVLIESARVARGQVKPLSVSTVLFMIERS